MMANGHSRQHQLIAKQRIKVHDTTSNAFNM
jgi:hypothetical protein